MLQSQNDTGPVEILEHVWPGLMFGNLLFSRCGVRVQGGRDHIAKEIAECSTLYFTYRRLHRKTSDRSMGWGSNSQWRTSFRRDYEHDGYVLYNVDGEIDLTSDSQFEKEDELTVRQRIEHCKNRSFLITKKDDTDLWPIGYRYQEKLDRLSEFDSQWLTWNGGVVKRLADSILEQHAFDRLPILADALEEAGCCDETILKHCREAGKHGPRCWVVEYLLGVE